MFKNYLIIALRRFWRQKVFSIVNVLGLSIGMAVAIVMIVSIQIQFDMDNFHEKGPNIYRLSLTYFLPDQQINSDGCAAVWGEDIRDNFPEVKSRVRTIATGELLFNTFNESGEIEKKFVESQGLGVDSLFFDLFTFPLKQGDAGKVLIEPFSIVLSEEFAQKYFGNENALGKSILINNKYNLKVTGVLEKLPQATQLGYDYYVPMEFLTELGFNTSNEGGNAFNTYLLLEDNVNHDSLSADIKDHLYSKYERDVEYEPFLICVNRMFMFGNSLNIIISSIFAAIALFILIMACVNFMNLSTATSLKRAKEIAIRKIVGAHRSQIAKQLLGESILLAFLSLNLAIVFTELILDFFNRYLNESIHLDFADTVLWGRMIILALFTGVLAGSYPALFLSSFKPVKVLSFNVVKSGGGRFRKILVVFQFTLSILFLSATILSYRQYVAIRNHKIGIDTKHVLSIPIKGEITKNYNLIKEELLQNPKIVSVTSSNEIPTNIMRGEFMWGTSPDKNKNLTRFVMVDHDFLEVFNIKLKEGRFYSEDYSTDSIDAIVVNEEIVNLLKLDDPIGKQIYFMHTPYRIIGVVEYFNFFPVELGGKGLIIDLDPGLGNIYIKYTEDAYPFIQDYIKNIFEKYNKVYPYEYSFFEDYETSIEEGINNINKTLLFFTLLGICIAVLGLLGLSAFMVEQKSKEIGIRKAMGAGVNRIIAIITKQFFKLILIANIIALPISYYIGKYTKSFFDVKPKGDVYVFLLVVVAIFILAFIIIFAVTIKAARANPTKSLRYE